MPIHLVSISSEICEDSYEEGEGRCTGCGLDKERIGKDFKSKEEMFKWLSDNYGLYDNEGEYDCENGSCQTDKQVADHSDEQNGGWFEPTDEEIKEWKKGNIKLYNEHYWIRFHKY